MSKFKIKLEKKYNINSVLANVPLIEITPGMQGIKSIQYFLGEEIDFKHSQIDLKGQPVAVISYHSAGADTVWLYNYNNSNRWELIGSKKLFK